MKEMKEKRGFTLAEVIVTLTILGVIGAITIPSIIHNNQTKINKTRLKKAMTVYDNVISQISIFGGIKTKNDFKNWADDNNCKNSLTFFKYVPNTQDGCKFKTSDGVWWDISDITHPIIAFKQENLNTIVADSSQNDAFYFVTNYDNEGVMRINDLSWEEKNNMYEDYYEDLVKLYNYILNTKKDIGLTVKTRGWFKSFNKFKSITCENPTFNGDKCTNCQGCQARLDSSSKSYIYDENGNQIGSCYRSETDNCQHMVSIAFKSGTPYVGDYQYIYIRSEDGGNTWKNEVYGWFDGSFGTNNSDYSGKDCDANGNNCDSYKFYHRSSTQNDDGTYNGTVTEKTNCKSGECTVVERNAIFNPSGSFNKYTD